MGAHAGGVVEGRPERVSVQFEDDRLFPWMDASANVTLVGCNEAYAIDLFGLLGLAGKEHARIAELSGGQLRRVALARALAYPATIVLLDEPTARLDATSSAAVLEVIKKRCDDALVVVATHDQQVIERCDMVLHIENSTKDI